MQTILTRRKLFLWTTKSCWSIQTSSFRFGRKPNEEPNTSYFFSTSKNCFVSKIESSMFSSIIARLILPRNVLCIYNLSPMYSHGCQSFLTWAKQTKFAFLHIGRTFAVTKTPGPEKTAIGSVTGWPVSNTWSVILIWADKALLPLAFAICIGAREAHSGHLG